MNWSTRLWLSTKRSSLKKRSRKSRHRWTQRDLQLKVDRCRLGISRLRGLRAGTDKANLRAITDSNKESQIITITISKELGSRVNKTTRFKCNLRTNNRWWCRGLNNGDKVVNHNTHKTGVNNSLAQTFSTSLSSKSTINNSPLSSSVNGGPKDNKVNLGDNVYLSLFKLLFKLHFQPLAAPSVMNLVALSVSYCPTPGTLLLRLSTWSMKVGSSAWLINVLGDLFCNFLWASADS